MFISLLHNSPLSFFDYTNFNFYIFILLHNSTFKNFKINNTNFYNIILQITTLAIIPTISAVNAAQRTNLVFFIFTLLVYTAIVYKVVSVDPIIVAAIIPILLSTPKFFIISVAIAIELLPDIGLNIANGIISLGKFKISKIGVTKLIIKSNIPELLKAPIATNNPINVGKIFNTIFNPSFAPFSSQPDE